MATLKEYFDKDFSNTITLHAEWELHTNGKKGKVVTPIARVHVDFNSNAKFISYYIPECSNVRAYSEALLAKNDEALKMLDSVDISTGYQSKMDINSKSLVFTKQVYIYSESDMTKEDESTLVNSSKKQSIVLIFRGNTYLTNRQRTEKPLAFLSHDSLDKNEIARPLAIQLQNFMCPVWFDEFSLNPGDGLRESIEKGIKECKKCILVLSPNFLKNNGWTKKEFNSIFTRELIEEKKLILPVWHNVSKQEVYNYSPSLADIVAVNSSIGIIGMAKKLLKSIL